MRHLLECWNKVGGRLRSARLIALFLDFDGTLARLRPRPEEVWMDGQTRRLLGLLARSKHFRVWIVSGRRQADIRARVRVPGIRYLGLHGWEGRSSSALAEETRRVLTCTKIWAGSLLMNLPGVWLEDKDYALAIHYRSASAADVRRARKLVRGVVEPFAATLKIVSGNKIWEVLPHEIEDKGAAVKHELTSLPRHAVAVYLGDDTGDEPAFAAVPDGITVRVGAGRPTNARYRLANVQQVRQFLERLGAEFA